jgi:hypothetical protein
LIRIGDDSSSLHLGSLLQVRGQRGGDGGLAVQRLRARAEGKVASALDLTMLVEFELGGDDPGLLDAIISFAPVSPHLLYLGRLRLGRFRVPHARSVLTDPEFLGLNERPLGASLLAPRRRTGLVYDLDLGTYGIPVRLRGGGFDGFPETEGFGPLSVVRIDVAITDLFDVPFRLQLGSAYTHDTRHQDQATGLVYERQGVAVDGRLDFSGYHLQAELLLGDHTDEEGMETLGWSLTAGAFVLPDFLELVARYEELHRPDASDMKQVAAGVNLFYLAERFKMTYNFVWRRESDIPDATRHLVVFQLVL